MNNILILSQDGLSVYPSMIGIGHRQEIQVIGDKIKEQLNSKNMSAEELINIIGNSYRKNIERIIENQEIPSPKLVEKLEKALDVEKDFFKDKETSNLVCVQGGIVIGRYDTNARAEEVKNELQEIQKEAHLNNKQVIYEMPEK